MCARHAITACIVWNEFIEYTEMNRLCVKQLNDPLVGIGSFSSTQSRSLPVWHQRIKIMCERDKMTPEMNKRKCDGRKWINNKRTDREVWKKRRNELNERWLKRATYLYGLFVSEISERQKKPEKRFNCLYAIKYYTSLLKTETIGCVRQ